LAKTKSDKPVIIGFKTLGDWSATESQTLIKSVSTVYNICLLFLDYELTYYETHITLPLLGELESISHIRSNDDLLELRLSEYFQNFDQYLLQKQQLMVYRIRIGSDGIFTFTGSLEGIILQVRQLIKDLLFRNKKEKQLKTIEISERILQLINEVDNPDGRGHYRTSPVAKRLYGKILKLLELQLDNLISLESKGKLADISENIEYVPDDSDDHEFSSNSVDTQT
jgi:hypothetical protein